MSKTIVITGAGAGLGCALARRFAADGDSVVLLGRTPAKVAKVASEIGARAMAVGLNLRERPISQFTSVTHIFRALIDLPPDLQAGSVVLRARKP